MKTIAITENITSSMNPTPRTGIPPPRRALERIPPAVDARRPTYPDFENRKFRPTYTESSPGVRIDTRDLELFSSQYQRSCAWPMSSCTIRFRREEVSVGRRLGRRSW